MIMTAVMAGMVSCACSSGSAEEKAGNVESPDSDCADCSGCEEAEDACAAAGYAGCDSTMVKDTSFRR